MTRVLRLLAVVAALAGGQALAHEHGGNAKGTVESITPSRIVVKTSDGHDVPFGITKDTRFLRGEKPVRAEDVVVGQRVVVHGTQGGEVLQATQVKLGAEPARK